MTGARHTYLLTTDDNGRLSGRAFTNDNLDRGEPSEDADWSVSYDSRAQAMQRTGGTHTGMNGCDVTVHVDGVRVDRQGVTIARLTEERPKRRNRP